MLLCLIRYIGIRYSSTKVSQFPVSRYIKDMRLTYALYPRAWVTASSDIRLKGLSILGQQLDVNLSVIESEAALLLLPPS
jgi:hypothetical protein